MTPAARYAAAIDVLDEILTGGAPEPVLANWGRRNRYAGSKDRAALRDIVFDALRAKRSLSALGGSETGRGLILGLVRRDDIEPGAVFGAGAYAPSALTEAESAHLKTAVAFSDGESFDLPDWLIPSWRRALGEAAQDVATISKARGPVTLRVNRAKADLDSAIAALSKEDIGVRPIPDVATALLVERNPRRVLSSAAYRDGLVELQDAASQAAMAVLPLLRGDHVLDYCAGGGGKALAIWDRTRSAVFAHDADPRRMVDLPARAERAGAEVVCIDGAALTSDAPFDLVLCDAPCSGSGTWRRTPMAKWELSEEKLNHLRGLQAEILAQAAPLVGPSGTLAYATCSILVEENEDIVEGFLADHPNWRIVEVLRLSPGNDRDGFFLAQFRRTD